MNNKTQRKIHKYFFSHYFCFVFFRKNNIRGNAATNNTPNDEKKNIEERSRKSKGYNTNVTIFDMLNNIINIQIKQ
jgi:uncharacterized protein (UPF0333 family)